ncbi:MAG: ABC transporter ATP-binding protein [Desulforhopalus sp.]
MSNSPLFCLDTVSFAYNDAPVLHELSVTLPRGRFYGIVGPNGCGKTTFLDLLCGLRKPFAGTIKLEDRPLDDYSRRNLSCRIALVPQDFDTGFGFTVEEIVLMGRHPHIRRFAAPSSKDWQAVDRAMDSIGIGALRHRQTNTLSGGQKQRAVVARALAQNTSVLLFDEATSSLDIQYTLQIFNICRRLVQDEGRTVIAVMHNLNLAAAYCEHLIFMKEGRIMASGPTDDTMTADTIRDVFGVHAQVSKDPFNNARQVSFRYWE